MTVTNLHTFMLAPMAELGHRALRELIHGFFSSLEPNSAGLALAPQASVSYFTEMISAAGLLAGGPFEKWYLDNGPCPRQLVYQLVGANPDQLVKAAILLDRQECLGIDINMGCSAPAITRTGAGVRWMEDPDNAARLAERLRKVTKKQLSVKIRLGPKVSGYKSHTSPNPENTFDMGAEPENLQDFPFLLRFCRGLEEAGIDLIILHPRGAREKFKRRARWEYVEALRKELDIPMAGNGDISSIEEFTRKADAGPVMAGRLLVREPWAFAAVSVFPGDGPKYNVEETGFRFLELLARYQPPEFHLSRARRFFRYFCENVSWAEHLRNNINREDSLTGIEKVWREYFSEAIVS